MPSAVRQELRNEEAPKSVTHWAAALPDWVEVHAAPPSIDWSLNKLDEGERSAILLAQTQVEPVLLLLDEMAGRREAARRQLQVTGTLGILRSAALRDWIDLSACFARLRQTNFRQPIELMTALLAEDAERKRGLL